MTEIYRNTSGYVNLDIYGGTATGTPTAKIGTESLTVSAGTGTGFQRWQAFIDLDRTNNDKALKVDWAFVVGGKSLTKVDYVDVVTPYISTTRLKTIYPTRTDEEVAILERLIRYTIDAYTGQSFGRYEGVKRVFGAGNSKIMLPEPLLSVIGIVVNGNELTEEQLSYFQIYGDGRFYGPIYNSDYLTIKQHHTDGLGPDQFGLIRAPRYSTTFANDIVYEIEGVWGYDEVPGPVQLAAEILANTYGCRESTYRNSYLDSVRAGETRFEFNSRAWQGTGHVQADQLLDQYKDIGMAVI